MISTVLDRETDVDLQTGEPIVAHIIKSEPGKSASAIVTEARVFGTALEALCGETFVPQRDPKKYPMCDVCKEIYMTYRDIFGLNDTPSE